MIKLTEENYFSPEAEMYYTGSTQIKNFLKCEAATMAKLKGEWTEEKSKAMTVSSYIDEALTGDLTEFYKRNPDIFKRDGTLKADYEIANIVVEFIQKDPKFLKYIDGEHQKILTGKISGVPVKIKIDSYFPNKLIVDLKAVANFNLIWNEITHQKENFIDYYDYILQGALYQEIEHQNSKGEKVPFVIAATTKEAVPERALLNIPQEDMNVKLEFLKSYLPHIQALKQGKIEPTFCGKCDFCKTLAKTTKIYNYRDYFEMRGGN